jgi:hypothetical protein
VGAGLALALVISVVVGGGTAYGDKAYRTERLEFNLTPAGAVAGHPELRAGQFVNVHANGPVIYTQERFMLNGARPETVYQLVLRFQDGCEGPVLFDFPFVVLETDGHGNAHARNTFHPEDVSLRGTIHITAILVDPAGVDAYTTPCFDAVLD